MGRFLPANEFSGEPFASSRRSARELGRTRANSAELRRTRSAYSGERPAEFGGLSVLANRWRVRAEFARVRSSSREFAANDSSPGILPGTVALLTTNSVIVFILRMFF